MSKTWWALVLLLVACFALGGSARGDVAQLMVLRPLAVLFLGYGLWTLRWRHVTAHRFLWAMAIALVALPALQLIPLPPQIWHQLPGRGLVVEIDKVADLGAIWRPLSLTPIETRNAFFAVLVPFAGFVLGMQLSGEERSHLLPVVLILGGLSASLGLLQTLGDPHGPLYFYPITNNGSAVGIFANRNHQALLLAMMLPMFAVMASARGPGMRFAAWLAAFMLLPLVLITGSRSGLIVAGLGLAAIPIMLSLGPTNAWKTGARIGRRRQFKRALAPGLALLGLGLVALTIWLGRGVAWDRFFAAGAAADLRIRILPTLFTMIRTFMPFGSGMGSFERVYQVHEPDALLSPIYMNRAHDDWLEVLLTGGVAAALLLLLASLAFLIQAKRALLDQAAANLDTRYARLGLVLILLAGVASVSDYPLRTPALALIFVVAVLWAGCSLQRDRSPDAVPQTNNQ